MAHLAAAMKCSDFVNDLKLFICFVKHHISRANHGYSKTVVIDRWATMRDFISRTIFCKF